MRRRFAGVRRRFALRWHRTQRHESASPGEGCAWGCLLAATFWVFIGLAIIRLAWR